MTLDTLGDARGILASLRAETRRLVRRASFTAERAAADLKRAEGLDFTIAELQRALAFDPSGHDAVVANDAVRRAIAARYRAERLVELAELQPVNRIVLKPLGAPYSEGWMALTVDDRRDKTVHMPPAVALLAFILLNAATAEDGFPEWQSFKAISGALALDGRDSLTRRAIVQRVYRLRGLLERGGAHRGTLRVDRRFGLRLLVQRSRGA